MISEGCKVRGYEITRRLSGGGKSQSAEARRDGASFFVKWFLAPKYPSGEPKPDDPRAEKIRSAVALCQEFETRQTKIMARLRQTIAGGGNLVKPCDFFRESSTYIKVFPYVQGTHAGVVTTFPAAHQEIFVKTLVLAVRELHAADVVHGDLKMDNVLVEWTDQTVIAKLIDFDEAYISARPPGPALIGGDPAYASPELAAYLTGATVDPATLTPSSDIFSLGLLIHRLLVGELPVVTGGSGSSAAGRVSSGGRVVTAPLTAVAPRFAAVLEHAFDPLPANRPDIDDLAGELAIPRLKPPERIRSTSSPARRGPQVVNKKKPRTSAHEEPEEPATGSRIVSTVRVNRDTNP